jgi:hypothetical protein
MYRHVIDEKMLDGQMCMYVRRGVNMMQGVSREQELMIQTLSGLVPLAYGKLQSMQTLCLLRFPLPVLKVGTHE